MSPLSLRYFLVKLVRYALLFWLPFFLVKAAGLTAAQAAVLATLFAPGSGAEFAPDGRCSAQVVAPRRARRGATANRRSNCLRSDLRRAKIDDFCALRAHGVAGGRAPSSATPRGEARNVVPDEC